MNIDADVLLGVYNLSKQFPGVKALDNVSVEIHKGEILAILGENGAGKSTLMKILAGLYQPDEGQIFVNRAMFDQKATEGQIERIRFYNPREAMKLGIGMVYQHFQLIEPFTVADNIMLGNEFTYKIFSRFESSIINRKYAVEEIRRLSENFGLPIDPKAMVEDLPVGLKQRVEILKQLYRNAELLILDEPTAVLTPEEVEELFITIRRLKKLGKSIIFISHKLHEPLEIADRIVVLRKGKYIGETFPSKTSKKGLAEMVVGKKVILQYDRKPLQPGKPVLEVQKLTAIDPLTDQQILTDISFTIRENQIVGVAGVQGNGQSELAEALIGLHTIESGKILLRKNGKLQEVQNKTTLDILRTGVAYIPEDRTHQGLILDFDIAENVWLDFFGTDADDRVVSKYDEKTDKYERFRKYLLPFNVMKNLAAKIVANYDIRTGSIETKVRNLSGGNQQKVLLGREFAKQPRLIIASQPTRGVDIGIMEQVHRELIKRRDEGAAVLLVSSDLDEVLNLSDYLLVIYDGQIVGSGKTEDFPLNELSQLMTGGKLEEATK